MYCEIEELDFQVRDEGCYYASRSYPFTAEDVLGWARELPPEHIRGLLVTIKDASVMGNGGLRSAGQYIKSAAQAITSDNPFGLVRLFTLKVRHLKRGPIWTDIWGRDYKSWMAHDMADLWEHCKYVFFHEVGHYMHHRAVGRGGWGPLGEVVADRYAANPETYPKPKDLVDSVVVIGDGKDRRTV